MPHTRLLFGLIGSLLFALPITAVAETAQVATRLGDAGYVSVPLKRGDQRRLYIDGKIHGEPMRFLIDFSNDGAVFDTRRLRKMDVELTKTDRTIPTRRKTVVIHTAEILGLEFSGKSTPRMSIMAGDVDAIYGVAPGKDGPDGILGIEFLKSLGGVLDFETMTLHLKLR